MLYIWLKEDLNTCRQKRGLLQSMFICNRKFELDKKSWLYLIVRVINLYLDRKDRNAEL